MKKKLRNKMLIGAGAACALAAVAVPSFAGSAEPWDDAVAAKPAVLERAKTEGDTPRDAWRATDGLAPVAAEARRIYAEGTRTAWLTPSNKGGVCLVLEVSKVEVNSFAGCFLADSLAKPEPFVFSTSYSLTVGLVTADGEAAKQAAIYGGRVAAPNLVLIETVDSDTALAPVDPIELYARYQR